MVTYGDKPRRGTMKVILEEPSSYTIDEKSIPFCLAKISLLSEHKNKSKPD